MSLGQFMQDLQDLAPSQIALAGETSVDLHNQSTYGAPVTYSCLIAGPVKFLHRLSGQERVSSQTIYVFSADQLSARAQLTLPPGYDGTLTPKIAQIDRQTDEQGFAFSVLYLG